MQERTPLPWSHGSVTASACIVNKDGDSCSDTVIEMLTDEDVRLGFADFVTNGQVSCALKTP